ncbi:hypothetical protein [Lichenicoccus sp.]
MSEISPSRRRTIEDMTVRNLFATSNGRRTAIPDARRTLIPTEAGQ